MKKYMTMPDVKIVRFDTNDVITTSGPSTVGVDPSEVVTTENVGTQGRNSIWD